jgi:hypothetical protein
MPHCMLVTMTKSSGILSYRNDNRTYCYWHKIQQIMNIELKEERVKVVENTGPDIEILITPAPNRFPAGTSITLNFKI